MREEGGEEVGNEGVIRSNTRKACDWLDLGEPRFSLFFYFYI